MRFVKVKRVYLSWKGINLATGEIFRSPIREYSDLKSVMRSIKRYTAKHLSNVDPDDLVFEIYRIRSGRHTLIHVESRKDMSGEVIGISEPHERMYWEDKRDNVLEDIDTKGLDVVQRGDLARMVYKIKEGKEDKYLLG